MQKSKIFFIIDLFKYFLGIIHSAYNFAYIKI